MTAQQGDVAVVQIPEQWYARLVARTEQDAAFKARLLTNSVAALREIGVELAAGRRVEVREASAERAYLLLRPPASLPTLAEPWHALLTRASTDLAFKAQLVAEPARMLRDSGLAVPDDLALEVLEPDPSHSYVVLPPTDLFSDEPAGEEEVEGHGAGMSRRSFLRALTAVSAGAATMALVGAGATGKLPGGLLAPAGAAAAGAGKLLFFYNQATGAGALGYFSGSQGYQGFVTVKNWGPGSWATGWTLIAASPYLFKVAVGDPTLNLAFYSSSSLHTTELLLNGHQNVVTADLNLATLSAAIQPSGGRYAGLAPWFSQDIGPVYQYYDPNAQIVLLRDGLEVTRASTPQAVCTHLVCVPQPGALGRAILLYYNAYTGDATTSWVVQYTDVNNWQTSDTHYPPGKIGAGWTHIVPNDPGTGAADILFYNKSTGGFSVARLDTDGTTLVTVLGGGPGSFGTWTHVVAAGSEGWFFYNQQSGAVATGVVDTSSSIWQFRTTRSISSGFSTGWTHIV